MSKLPNLHYLRDNAATTQLSIPFFIGILVVLTRLAEEGFLARVLAALESVTLVMGVCLSLAGAALLARQEADRFTTGVAASFLVGVVLLPPMISASISTHSYSVWDHPVIAIDFILLAAVLLWESVPSRQERDPSPLPLTGVMLLASLVASAVCVHIPRLGLDARWDFVQAPLAVVIALASLAFSMLFGIERKHWICRRGRWMALLLSLSVVWFNAIVIIQMLMERPRAL